MADPQLTKVIVAQFHDLEGDMSEAEYVDWWENGHIPFLRRMPGLLEVARYIQIDGRKPAHLFLLEWRNVLALGNRDLGLPEGVRHGISCAPNRTYAEQTSSGGDVSGPHIISMNVLTPKEGSDEDFERWYDDEHVPMLSNVPGFLRARRFKTYRRGEADLDGPAHCTIQEYAGVDAWETPEFKEAGSTEWRARVVANTAKMDRRVFRFEKRVAFQDDEEVAE